MAVAAVDTGFLYFLFDRIADGCRCVDKHNNAVHVTAQQSHESEIIHVSAIYCGDTERYRALILISQRTKNNNVTNRRSRDTRSL